MIFESWLQQLFPFNLFWLFVFFLIENSALVVLSVLIGKTMEPENTFFKE